MDMGDRKTRNEERKYYDYIIRQTNILKLTGKFDEAIELLTDQEFSIQKLGDIHILARYHYALATLYESKKDWIRTRKHLAQSEHLYQAVQDRTG